MAWAESLLQNMGMRASRVLVCPCRFCCVDPLQRYNICDCNCKLVFYNPQNSYGFPARPSEPPEEVLCPRTKIFSFDSLRRARAPNRFGRDHGALQATFGFVSRFQLSTGTAHSPAIHICAGTLVARRPGLAGGHGAQAADAINCNERSPPCALVMEA